MDVISNSQLCVRVDPLGAEMKSLKSFNDGLEYLWQGDEQYWPGQSPILFPIIGGLPDNRFCYQGKTYEMLSHGFAREARFEVIDRQPDQLVLQLTASEDTLRQYPFLFRLSVSYKLEGNTLVHGFKVENLDDKTMLFSVGAHPGFRCPLQPDDTMDDYDLVFERAEHLARRIKSGRLLSGETLPFLENSNCQPLSHKLFYTGAIILDQVKSQWLDIRHRSKPQVIRVEFAGFPYLGIWSAANDAPYVCIEPWYGVDSTQGDSFALEAKEGLQTLQPGASFACSYQITINP